MSEATKCAAGGLSPAYNGVPDQSRRRAQRHANTLGEQKNAVLKANFFLLFFPASALHTLTQSLRGEVDPGRPYPLIIPLS